MSDSKAHIRDAQSLEELHNTLEYGADSLLKILESVNDYLQGILQAMEKQMEVLKKQLEEAEKRLEYAEDALRSCESSQEYDEESGEYYPSCSVEQSAVQSARKRRDECQKKHDDAQKILDECKYEVAEYKKEGGFIIPPGGEKTLEYLAQTHTDKASEKLRVIIDKVSEYQKTPASLNGSGNIASSDSGKLAPVVVPVNEDSIPLTAEEKKERQQKALREVIDRQKDESHRNDIADANRCMVCPKCGRPYVCCICRNLRDEEYTRKEIHIIK